MCMKKAPVAINKFDKSAQEYLTKPTITKVYQWNTTDEFFIVTLTHKNADVTAVVKVTSLLKVQSEISPVGFLDFKVIPKKLQVLQYERKYIVTLWHEPQRKFTVTAYNVSITKIAGHW